VAGEITMDDLFNTDRPNNQLRFDFETRYQPYEQFAFDDIGAIDLVVKHHGVAEPEGWRRPLEIKLTVMPDNTTCSGPEQEWSPELVIRPASTKYCALGIYSACRARRTEIRDIFQNVCGNFQVWNSAHELQNKRDEMLNALDIFQRTLNANQQPFLIQPIWKTEGKSPSLAQRAFDLFVWSDFADLSLIQ
jgi:HindVP-like restriction endonuclease